eukprot:TRINITY_DN26395_c0_g1_i1.p1 TRINITY_DN26395_c0_g1~~TRINITY_DN26395_c0_g1_i1.p1  ORF type:complete len:2324 (-),score=348.81 TRINITY_DN26395_c0_g1_i1:181-6945(-)
MTEAANAVPELYPLGVDFVPLCRDTEEEHLKEYLESPQMSVPFIFITQLAAYLNDQTDRGTIGGCIGHSQGLAAALVLSCTEGSPAALHEKGKEMLRLLIVLGQELAGSTKLNGQKTGMLSVAKLSENEVQRFLNDTKNDSHLSITLVNDKQAIVVGGVEADLICFTEVLRQRVRPEEFKVSRVKAACVFHCEAHLGDVFSRCAAWLDQQRQGRVGAYELRGAHLQTSVFDGDRDLKNDLNGDMYQHFLSQVCLRQVRWQDTIQTMLKSTTSDVMLYDYGPGLSILELSKRIVGSASSGELASLRGTVSFAPSHMVMAMTSTLTTHAATPAFTDDEARVATIWAEVLDLPANILTSSTGFFEYGGTSLSAMEVITRLYELTGVHVAMNELFEAPTITGMAATFAARLAEVAERAPELAVVDRYNNSAGWWPASYGEEQMLVLMDTAPTAYNMPFALKLTGKLDPAWVKAAALHVMERHEALCTVLRWGPDGRVEQRVMLGGIEAMLDWSVIDAQGTTLDERWQRARAIVKEEGNRAFNLHQGPITRVSLVKSSEEDWLLLVCIHHHISDGWTIVNLRRELLMAIDARARGTSPHLPELPLQYVDWTLWHRGWLEGNASAQMKKELGYWTKELADPPILEMFLDKPRPAVLTDRGGTVEAHIPPSVAQELRAVCKTSECTLFMALVSLYGICLARHTNQSEVVIGYAIAGRDQPGMRDLLGYFANEVALRIDCSKSPSFRDMLSRVRQKVLSAYANQHVPFHKVVEALNLPRERRRTVVYQAMFALQERSWHELDVDMHSGLEASIERWETHSSKFELHLQFRERKDGGIDGDLHYASDLFDRSTAMRFARHIEELAKQAIASPNVCVHKLNILTQEEQVEYASWNSTETDFGLFRRVEVLFEERARQAPSAPALCFGDAGLTFQETSLASERLAASLIAHGVGKGLGEKVALMLDRGLDQVVATLAVLKLGAAIVPIDVHHTPQERATFILQDAGVKIVISHDVFREYLRDIVAMVEVVYFSSLASGPGDGADTLPIPPPRLGVDYLDTEAVFGVYYTSGTTGLPKGALILHRNVQNLAFAFSKFSSVSSADRILQFSSYSFIMSLRQIWPTLIGGACLVLLADPLLFGHAINRHQVTKLVITASAMGAIDPADHPSIKAIQFGGEKVPLKVVQQWAGRGVKIQVGLGPTELTGHAMCNPSVTADVERVTIGSPHDNVRCYITNGDSMQIQPSGVVGELCIAGSNVCNGYINRKDLTAEHFLPNPFVSQRPHATEMLYRTGDLAVRLITGDVLFLGRQDDQVKIHGYRIELQEIQIVIESFPHVTGAAVIVHDEKLCAYVTPATIDEVALRAHLADRVTYYMMPWSIVRLDKMPLNKNGKLDRAALPRPEVGRESKEDQLPLETPTQTWVAGELRKVLSIPADQVISRSHNFFDMGGSSLTAALVIRRLNERNGCHVSVTTLFENQTIEALARAIDLSSATSCVTEFWADLDDAGVVTSSEAPLGTVTYGVLQALLVLLLLLMNLVPIVCTVLGIYFVADKFALQYACLIVPGFLLGVGLARALLILIAKWCVVGRLRPGVYPTYGVTFLRWWFNGKLGSASAMWIWALNETPYIAFWYRLLGAKVGATAFMDHVVMFEPDLVTIGDNFSGEFECVLSTSEVVQQKLVLREVVLGSMVRLGVRATIAPGTAVPDHVEVSHFSAVSDRSVLAAGEVWSGNPAERVTSGHFADEQHIPRETRGCCYAALQAVALWLVLLLQSLPFVCVAVIGIRMSWRWGFRYASGFLATCSPLPLALGYLLVLLLSKWLLVGRTKPDELYNGKCFLLRRWIVDRLLDNPMYHMSILVILDNSSTGPWFYRLLGVHIGSGQTWMSAPLLRVGLDVVSFGESPHMGHESCFFADALSPDGVVFKSIRIGNRVTFGQHTCVRGGVNIGDDNIIGANSLLPTGFTSKPKSTVVGAPPLVFEVALGSAAITQQTQDVVRQISSRSLDADLSMVEVGKSENSLAPCWKYAAFSLATVLCQVAVPAAMMACWVGLFFFWADLVLDGVHEAQKLYLLAIMPCVLFTGVGGICVFMWVMNVLGAFYSQSGETEYFSIRFFKWHLFSEILYSWTNRVMSAFAGTRVYTAWLASMGAEIGAGVFIDVRSGGFREVDHMKIEAGAVLLTQNVHAHYIDHGKLQFAPVYIGRGACINDGSYVMPLTRYEPNCVLRPYTCTTKGQIVLPDSVVEGNPAVRTHTLLPLQGKNTKVFESIV